jgi:hypothetical protein
VCTGVYQGGPHSNDPHDPAEFVYSDVQQCVNSLLRLGKVDRQLMLCNIEGQLVVIIVAVGLVLL